MARVTIEDCLDRIGNRFLLVQAATKRARQLMHAEIEPTVQCKNKELVTALREIAAGTVTIDGDVAELEHMSIRPPDDE